MNKYYCLTETKSTATGESDSAASSSKGNRVESTHNRIYFYSEVTRTNNLTLNKELRNLEDKLVGQAQTLGMENPSPIYLHINSYGGSVFAGFSSVDYILNSKVPVVTIIDGCAASAATLMSICGTHRVMNKHAFMLVHQISSVAWGKFEELKDSMKNNELLMDTIKNMYIERTKIPKKKLGEILKHDLWWDAKTCLEYGLVDEVI